MATTAVPADMPIHDQPAELSLREAATGAHDLPLTWRRFFWRAVGFGLNLVLFIFLFQMYKIARKSFIQRGERIGTQHAHQLIGWEKDVHLFFEPHLQHWILERPEWVIHGLNYYYVGFMPLFYGCCGFAMLFGPVQFRFWRRVFLTSMVLALPWYAIYPLAPPRFMPEYGFIDTLMKYGPHYFSNDGMVAANQYAAMPSMHIGWSTIGALSLATCLPRVKGVPLGVPIGLFHVSMMTLTVMATGNHYFFDEIGGWIIVSCALLIAWKVIPRIPFGFPRLLSPE